MRRLRPGRRLSPRTVPPPFMCAARVQASVKARVQARARANYRCPRRAGKTHINSSIPDPFAPIHERYITVTMAEAAGACFNFTFFAHA